MGYYYNYYANGQDGGADGSGDDGGSDGDGGGGGGGYDGGDGYVANQYNTYTTESGLSYENPSWWNGWTPDSLPSAPNWSADWSYQMGELYLQMASTEKDPGVGIADVAMSQYFFAQGDSRFNAGVQ